MTAADLKPRLRIGYVTPHPLNDTLQYEFYLMAPPGIMLMTAGLEIGDYSRDAVEEQFPALESRIGLLVRRGAQRIVIAGVPVAISLGRTRMLRLLSDVSEKWRVSADTALEATIAAAKYLGVRRIAAATRWKQPVNDRLFTYLAEAGLEPMGLANSGRTMQENARLGDEEGMRLATGLGREVLNRVEGAEGLVMPGSRWITLGAVRALEDEFAVPVITSHTASLWAALVAAEIVEPISGFGKLLASIADG